jgi:sugar-specific transcriptional regulator TrmB
MLTETSAVRSYFAKLGFESEVADIYLALYAEGPQTISALARSSGVERTKIYRLIDILLESNLIEVETHYKRGIIKAAPISNLHILITQKEQELKSLQDDLELIEQVLSRNSLSNPATRVQFYNGIEGIRQMQWDQTRSKTKVLTMIDEPIGDALGKAFTLRWAEAMNRNAQPLLMVVSPHFKTESRAWYEREKIPEIMDSVTSRVIEPDQFTISHNTDIWDDVVAYYNWKEGELYGIEIYNKDIAATQRVFFEMLWQLAKPGKPSAIIPRP